MSSEETKEPAPVVGDKNDEASNEAETGANQVSDVNLDADNSSSNVVQTRVVVDGGRKDLPKLDSPPRSSDHRHRLEEEWQRVGELSRLNGLSDDKRRNWQPILNVFSLEYNFLLVRKFEKASWKES